MRQKQKTGRSHRHLFKITIRFSLQLTAAKGHFTLASVRPRFLRAQQEVEAGLPQVLTSLILFHPYPFTSEAAFVCAI